MLSRSAILFFAAVLSLVSWVAIGTALSRAWG